jgi:DNA-binding PucR family transcriptional regulator
MTVRGGAPVFAGVEGGRPPLLDSVAERGQRVVDQAETVARLGRSDHRRRHRVELAAEGMLGLLEAAGGADVARRILLPLNARPAAEREMLTNAVAVWLSHNGAWDPSARELDVHRHTLRHRVSVIERLLGLDLSQFADRAELWAALQLVRRSTGTST